jgi:tyrosyl-tRNA synthetase
MWWSSKKLETTTSIAHSEALIDEVLTRSISTILPTKEGLKTLLKSGKRLRVYIGADATGPDLHLGHSTNFILLERLRRLGHEVIVLFGDFTAMIGDPTDKTSARVKLSKEEVDANIKTWKSQIEKIVDFKDGKNPARLVKNSDWLSKLRFADIIEIASHFTVQHMIERDMFEKRIAEKKPVYLHEFFYPLMQGYDSAVLDVDIEIGGNDQLFNMLAGRILQKKINNHEKFVLATTLLTDPKTGKKLMSKSEGGYVSLQDAPSDMYGKIMALPDEALVQLFIDCTLLPMTEIHTIEENLKKGLNPRDVKARLAKEIVTMYHNADDAAAAEEHFINTFKKGGMSSESKEVYVKQGALLVDVLLLEGIVESKSEFRRLVAAGAVRALDTDQKITDEKATIQNAVDLKVGKQRFVKLRLL